MPGGDRTGPLGLGSMTGRAAGLCTGYPTPGYMNPVSGRGRGLGFGRGRGWGHWSWATGPGWARASRGLPAWGGGVNPYFYGAPYEYYGYPAAPVMNPQQEAEMLKEQAKAMQGEINAINDRIGELGKAAQSEEKK